MHFAVSGKLVSPGSTGVQQWPSIYKETIQPLDFVRIRLSVENINLFGGPTNCTTAYSFLARYSEVLFQILVA